MNDNTLICRLCEYLSTVSFHAISEEMKEQVRWRVMDITGCLLSGQKAEGNSAFVEMVINKGGKAQALLPTHQVWLPVGEAAMVNSVLCRSYDFEAMTYSHLYGSLIPVSIAVGQNEKATGKELITAIAAAIDLSARIGAATGPGMPGDTDSVGTVTLLCCTAAAGKLYKLSAKAMQNAFGFALNMFCASFQNLWEGVASFKFMQGWSSYCAVTAAQMAALGWTAPSDALLGARGYFARYTPQGCRFPDHLTQSLGTRFYDFVIYKRYCGCRFTHAAIECALALRSRIMESPESFSYRVYISESTSRTFICTPFVVQEGDCYEVKALFSLQFAVACALIYGDVKPHLFSEEIIRSSRIEALIQRLEICVNKEFQADQCCIQTVEKPELCEKRLEAAGNPQSNPLQNKCLKEKFWYNVAQNNMVSNKTAAEFLALLARLEKLEDVNILTDIFV